MRTTGYPFPCRDDGALEGERVPRQWGARQAWNAYGSFLMHEQYTVADEGEYFLCHLHRDPRLTETPTPSRSELRLKKRGPFEEAAHCAESSLDPATSNPIPRYSPSGREWRGPRPQNAATSCRHCHHRGGHSRRIRELTFSTFTDSSNGRDERVDPHNDRPGQLRRITRWSMASVRTCTDSRRGPSRARLTTSSPAARSWPRMSSMPVLSRTKGLSAASSTIASASTTPTVSGRSPEAAVVARPGPYGGDHRRGDHHIAQPGLADDAEIGSNGANEAHNAPATTSRHDHRPLAFGQIEKHAHQAGFFTCGPLQPLLAEPGPGRPRRLDPRRPSERDRLVGRYWRAKSARRVAAALYPPRHVSDTLRCYRCPTLLSLSVFPPTT